MKWLATIAISAAVGIATATVALQWKERKLAAEAAVAARQAQAQAPSAPASTALQDLPPQLQQALGVTQQPRRPLGPPPAPPKPPHNYVMQDGLRYGYPQALSAQQLQAGQAGESIVMVLYAGERDGKHQVHILQGRSIVAAECAWPCKALKVMTIVDIDDPYLRREVHVQYLAPQPNMIGYQAISDAANGHLRNYGWERSGKAYQRWVDEAKGVRLFPLPTKPTSPADPV